MGRFAHENDYDALIGAAVDSMVNTLGPWPGGLTRAQAIAAVKAIIAKESAFNPAATRGEPQAGDASIGLMQVLYSTARQELGYPGVVGDPQKLTGLYTPGTNIYVGTKYLWLQLRRVGGGDIDAAFSAYNGGFRPSLGFGARRGGGTPRVCLQWKPTAPRDPAARSIDRDCAVVGSTTPGSFSNQRYVTLAHNYYDYFFVPPPGKASPARESPAPTG